jgi:WD40 repeat protein
MQLLTGYVKPITALAVTPDGTRLFSVAQGQNTIQEWDLTTRQVTRKLRSPHPGRYAIALAMSPRGDCFVSSGSQSKPTIWPLDGSEPWQLEESTRWQSAVAINQAGTLLATAWLDSPGLGVQLWRLPEGKRAGRSGSGWRSRITALAFSPTDDLVASTSPDRTVCLWDLQSGKYHLGLAHQVVPTQVAFRSDGLVLASAGARAVFLWDVASGKLLATLPGHKGNVTGLAYSPDGKYLLSIAADGVVILRDSATNEIVGQRDLEIGKLGAVCWRADSQGLFVGGNKKIAQCETAELLGTPRQRPRGDPLSLQGHGLKVKALRYSADGRMLASLSGERLSIWDLSGGAGQAREKSSLRPSTSSLVAWLPGGKHLALWSYWDKARVIDAETGKRIRDFDAPKGAPIHLSFTPTGRRLLIVSPGLGEPSMRLSLAEPGTDSGGLEVTIPDRACSSDDWFASVSEDEQHVYFKAGNNTVSRWAPATGKVEPVIRQTAAVAGAALSQDERALVTLGGANALVWDLPDGGKRLVLKHPLQVTGLACLPGGRLLTSCYDGLVRVWDLSGGTELFGLDLGMGRVYSLAVAPDHMTFAAGVEKQSRIVLMDVPE